MHNDGIVYFPLVGLEGRAHRPEPRVHRRRSALRRRRRRTGTPRRPASRRPRTASGSSRSGRAAGLAGRATLPVSPAGSRPTRRSRSPGPPPATPCSRRRLIRPGTRVLGTLNNCAMGFTPWGTYLACEENFNGYFRKTTNGPLEARYGIAATEPVPLAHDRHPLRPRRRAERGQPLRLGHRDRPVQAGLDAGEAHRARSPEARRARGSRRPTTGGSWSTWATTSGSSTSTASSPTSRGRRRFREDVTRSTTASSTSPSSTPTAPASGCRSRPTTRRSPAFAGLADILINTRAAADAVGATKMDRPEWIDVIDRKKEVYVTLTNNNRRGTGTNPPVDAANPRADNVYGHIVRWGYAKDFSDPVFFWEIFALAGDPADPAHGLDDHRRQVRLARRSLRRTQRAPVDPDRRVELHDRHGRLRRLRQQPDAVRRSDDQGDPALPRRPEPMRDHRGVRHPRRADACSSASSTPASGPTAHQATPPTRRPFSSWPDGAAGGRPRSCLIVITKDDGGKIGT